MVIDVTDLNIETLNFPQKCDSKRHKRGEKIYNDDLVEILQVNKIDNENYLVKATVEGNYDTYITNLEILKNTIINYSCTCEDFYNGNLCKHIIATAIETVDPHRPNTYDKYKEQQKKLWLEFANRQAEERKKQIYESKYNTGLHAIELYNQNIKQRTSNTLNLQEIYEESSEIKNQNNTNLDTSISIEFTADIEDSKTLKLSFKIGSKKMYVLNNISEFYNAYQTGSEIYYGKQLNFIPKKENFTEESQFLFDFIIKYAEIFNLSNKYNNYYTSSILLNKNIYISNENLDDFLEYYKDKGSSINLYNKDNKYEFTNETLDIYGILTKETVNLSNYSYYFDYDEKSEEYIFKLNIEDYSILYTIKYIYIFYNNKIYTMKKDEKLLKLFQLFDKNDEILIPEDKLSEFNNVVLSQIKYVITEQVPAEIAKEGLIVNNLACKILLDIDEENNINLELKFCYLDYEFNILEKEYEQFIKKNKIVRDIPAETEVIKRLFVDGFELSPKNKEFIMKNPDNIYDFLSNKIENYMNDFEVLVTDKFKNLKIKQPKISNIGIKIDNGLLELDISKINIDIDEIKNILKDYKIKKKYYKLKSGDFLDLTNNEDLNLLDEISATLDVDYGKIKNGAINLPINRSFYLEKLIDSKKEINISKNEQYTNLIDSIKNPKINIELDKNLNEKLRDYQKTGYKWLKTLEMYKFGRNFSR